MWAYLILKSFQDVNNGAARRDFEHKILRFFAIKHVFDKTDLKPWI